MGINKIDTAGLSEIKKCDSEYNKLLSDLSNSYNCNWNDMIHDSYLNYLKQIQDIYAEIHSINCNMNVLNKELEYLHIDEIKNETDKLCREADLVW